MIESKTKETLEGLQKLSPMFSLEELHRELEQSSYGRLRGRLD